MEEYHCLLSHERNQIKYLRGMNCTSKQHISTACNTQSVRNHFTFEHLTNQCSRVRSQIFAKTLPRYSMDVRHDCIKEYEAQHKWTTLGDNVKTPCLICKHYFAKSHFNGLMPFVSVGLHVHSLCLFCLHIQGNLAFTVMWGVMLVLKCICKKL